MCVIDLAALLILCISTLACVYIHYCALCNGFNKNNSCWLKSVVHFFHIIKIGVVLGMIYNQFVVCFRGYTTIIDL